MKLITSDKLSFLQKILLKFCLIYTLIANLKQIKDMYSKELQSVKLKVSKTKKMSKIFIVQISIPQ